MGFKAFQKSQRLNKTAELRSWFRSRLDRNHDRNFTKIFCPTSVLHFGPGRTEMWTVCLQNFRVFTPFFNPNSISSNSSSNPSILHSIQRSHTHSNHVQVSIKILYPRLNLIQQSSNPFSIH